MNTNKCPFQVGDRIRHAPSKMSYYDAAADERVTIDVASWYPDATVTKITDEGFEFSYDEPFLMGTRLGTTDGGFCYPIGFDSWQLIRTNDDYYWQDDYISL